MDIYLKRYQDRSFGWEWGADGNEVWDFAVLIRIAYFNILGWQFYKKGFEVWFLGFWWIY